MSDKKTCMNCHLSCHWSPVHGRWVATLVERAYCEMGDPEVPLHERKHFVR